MNTATLTPFHAATEHQPTRAGAYECCMTEKFCGDVTDKEQRPKHFRWFNGAKWSHPLAFDPDLDDGFEPPAADYYPLDADVAVHNERFEWRGYTEDQDPL